MDERRRADFVEAYTRILVSAWSSEVYTRRLQTEPVVAVAEHGLDVPAGSAVVVLDGVGGARPAPSLQAAIDTWLAGDDSGVYVLHVPATPQLQAHALDDDALAVVIGGTQVNQCCCTPCCCCT